jgi:hypothetical protein
LVVYVVEVVAIDDDDHDDDNNDLFWRVFDMSWMMILYTMYFSYFVHIN